MSFYRESGGGNVLIEACLCAFNKCKQLLLWPLLWKKHTADRVRLFQDSIPKCLKFTILPFKKSDFCNITSPFLSIRPP